MFRAQAAGPFDDVVAKATDENLTSEDWGAIIEVCDKVTGHANGPKEAAQGMIKRLAHRNANVQLYTLELAHALCQNCGKPMHREISSRAFTDALLKLANDRNTHNLVKAKILQKMKEWTDMFSKDTELGIMAGAYHRLKQTNPTLHPPSAPQKQGLTDADRQKEDEELQMALKLSLQEEERKRSASQPSASSQAGPSSRQESASAAPAVSAGTTAATVSRVRALYDFVPSEAGELEFNKGDVIAVLESVYKDWWRGSLKGKTGIFPLNYVEKLTDPTPDELQREAQMEAEVFAEIKNVEKLLTLLSASNTAPREEDNEEISKLYHQTLAIRPKLIKLIEKYSQKKDDFTQLNEKFIKARRDYEALLESSMSHPPQHNYQQYAIRPAPPDRQGYTGVGYPQSQPPPPPPQDAYYNQVPPSDHPPYQASSPPPNASFDPRGVAPIPAPFYVAGADVPPRGPGTPSMGPATGKQPAPSAHPSSSPTRPQSFHPYPQLQQQQAPSAPYSQPPPPHDQRRQSTYRAQELATSVYDAPTASQNPPAGASGQPYKSYNPDRASPSPPTAGQAPPPPHTCLSPPPLQPGGGGGNAGAYDSRHGLPGQGGGTGASPDTHHQPQYKPYVPPGGAADAPSPNDYYRQAGQY